MPLYAGKVAVAIINIPVFAESLEQAQAWLQLNKHQWVCDGGVAGLPMSSLSLVGVEQVTNPKDCSFSGRSQCWNAAGDKYEYAEDAEILTVGAAFYGVPEWEPFKPLQGATVDEYAEGDHYELWYAKSYIVARELAEKFTAEKNCGAEITDTQ